MAECRIKKYDNLPARVGWIDVDMHRWALSRKLKPSKLDKVPILNWFLTPSITKERIIFNLETAAREHKMRDEL